METYLQNIEYSFRFNEQGYFIFDEKIFDDEIVHKLSDFYLNSGIRNNHDFDVTKDNPNKSIVKAMMDLFENELVPILKQSLLNSNIQLISGSFLAKPQSRFFSSIYPHQDDTMIDISEQYIGFTCWIPLVDITLQNGCMGLINRSQNLYNPICANPADIAQNIQQDHIASLVKYINWIPMKKGSVLIFNHNTIHASLPNLSNENRLAIALQFTHKDATLCNYFLNPKNPDEIIKYKVDRNFFLNYSNERLTKLYKSKCTITEYSVLDIIKFNKTLMSIEILDEKLSQLGNVVNLDQIKYFTIKDERKVPFINRVVSYMRQIF
ncbi:MAG: phytanoyl-CoA dioxygenase family protein [Chitinophagales bacterium]